MTPGRALLLFAGFIAGAVGGFFLCFLVLAIGIDLLGWNNANGGLAMGVGMGLGPLTGLLCGLAVMFGLVRRWRGN